MGSLLLTAGTKGMRYALPNARIMIHQPLGGFRGQATDIQIHANEIMKTKNMICDIYAHHTEQSHKVIMKNIERDNFMSASEGTKIWAH